MYISAIGQDSHRFEPESSDKPLVLGGMVIPGCVGLKGNSDGDVVLHAVTNAVSGLHGVPVLGKIADDLCLKRGITDSKQYLAAALGMLTKFAIIHVSISIEAHRPRLAPHLSAMQLSIGNLLSLPVEHIALTATSGEDLTSFGKGEGIHAFAVVSARSK
ncbi:MAG: 2-C-methyl-D-erythritol 2,4-cyclodiphosphate synthase [Chitinispirillaceae bacterium]|nr:2-C-methyl-D-erythritol 2,4-cyclodiphosphate synthase [Chitinispirillaceae bacterium]